MKKLNGGKHMDLPVDELQIHKKAQRLFDEKWANQLATQFDPDAFGALTVVRIQGKYYIVDGQHRAWAARKFLGAGQLVPCMVFDVASDEEAAELFLAANRHKNVGALDKFFVRLVAKDETALAIAALMRKHDLVIARQAGEGCVRAVDACESVFSRQRGAKILDRVLGILRGAWGRNSDAYAAALIRGLGLVVVKYGDSLDDADLARKLARDGTPVGFLGKARDLKAAKGYSVAQGAAEKFIVTYNKGKRTSVLAEAA